MNYRGAQIAVIRSSLTPTQSTENQTTAARLARLLLMQPLVVNVEATIGMAPHVRPAPVSVLREIVMLNQRVRGTTYSARLVAPTASLALSPRAMNAKLATSQWLEPMDA